MWTGSCFSSFTCIFFCGGGGEKLSSDDQGMHRLFPFRNSPLKLRIGFQIEREIPTLEELGQETVHYRQTRGTGGQKLPPAISFSSDSRPYPCSCKLRD